MMSAYVDYDDDDLPVPQAVRKCGRGTQAGEQCGGTSLRFLVDPVCGVHASVDEKAESDRAKLVWATAVDEGSAQALGYSHVPYQGATVTTIGDHVDVAFAYNGAVIDALRSVPGRYWDPSTKTTRFPLAMKGRVIERLSRFGPVYEGRAAPSSPASLEDVHSLMETMDNLRLSIEALTKAITRLTQ